MIDDCTALILAGGDSRRMGRDKTVLPIGGQSLLQRAIELMQTLFPAVLVSLRQPRAELQAEQVCDEAPWTGPLAGLCAGLQRARTPWIFAVAADMPYLKPEIIEMLASRREGCQAVVPLIDGHAQTLTAFYATNTLPVFRNALIHQNKRDLRTVLAELDVRHIDEAALRAVDNDLNSFADLDTPEELAAARLQFGERSHE